MLETVSMSSLPNKISLLFCVFSGQIKAWDDLVNGNSDVGQGLDIIGGTILEAAGSELGING